MIFRKSARKLKTVKSADFSKYSTTKAKLGESYMRSMDSLEMM